jgi:hypothetical protein
VYYVKDMTIWKSWKYKNLTIFFASLVLAFVLVQLNFFRQLLFELGNWGYVGAFLAGALFVLSSTAAIGSVILFILAEKLSPLEIGIIAGLGAMVGDLTIFRFVKDNLANELEPLYERFGGNHLNHVLHSKYFHWTLPLIGALIIASPLPDEVGVSLMGISKMKTHKFVFISFLLNAAGIFIVISASLLLKH